MLCTCTIDGNAHCCTWSTNVIEQLQKQKIQLYHHQETMLSDNTRSLSCEQFTVQLLSIEHVQKSAQARPNYSNVKILTACIQ